VEKVKLSFSILLSARVDSHFSLSLGAHYCISNQTARRIRKTQRRLRVRNRH
jgi:hypothetical protein